VHLGQATVPLFVLYNMAEPLCCTVAEGATVMAIHAVIFDLGGVLIEIDWERYREDEHQGVLIENL
jgi:hypothetical protein